MDERIRGLVELIDQAIDIAQQRLNAKRAGQQDPSSEQGLNQIISGLQYRRDEAIKEGYEVSDTYVTLGLARAALEYDVSNSALVRKIGEVEQYFIKYFTRWNPS
jgi:hypothetical protein